MNIKFSGYNEHNDYNTQHSLQPNDNNLPITSQPQTINTQIIDQENIITEEKPCCRFPPATKTNTICCYVSGCVSGASGLAAGFTLLGTGVIASPSLVTFFGTIFGSSLGSLIVGSMAVRGLTDFVIRNTPCCNKCINVDSASNRNTEEIDKILKCEDGISCFAIYTQLTSR